MMLHVLASPDASDLTHCDLVVSLWQHRSGSTLARAMAYCLMASHYLNRCWLIIKGVVWHSPESNFTESAFKHNIMCSKIILLKALPHLHWINKLIRVTSSKRHLKWISKWRNMHHVSGQHMWHCTKKKKPSWYVFAIYMHIHVYLNHWGLMMPYQQCTWKTFMIHQTLSDGLYIFYSNLRNLSADNWA